MYNRVNHYWTFVLTIIIINSRKINSIQLRRCSVLMGGKKRYENEKNEDSQPQICLIFSWCFLSLSVHFISFHLDPISRMFNI